MNDRCVCGEARSEHGFLGRPRKKWGGRAPCYASNCLDFVEAKEGV